MHVWVLLQITTDDGKPGYVEEIAAWDKTAAAAAAEDIGLSLADGKTLLSAAQRRIVEAQTTAWVEARRCCEDCGRRATVKGRYPILYHTLFGDVALASPRFHRCRCRGDIGAATNSPLVTIIPHHIAPERLYLEARWASLVPYAAADRDRRQRHDSPTTRIARRRTPRGRTSGEQMHVHDWNAGGLGGIADP